MQEIGDIIVALESSTINSEQYEGRDNKYSY